MKSPGPDHPIEISAASGRVRVTFDGKTIADSSRALVMNEANYPPRHYVPREDADMTLLARTAHSTHCPYKGDASYYSIVTDGKTAENAIWTYETPYPAVRPIAGYLAFYADRVDKIEAL